MGSRLSLGRRIIVDRHKKFAKYIPVRRLSAFPEAKGGSRIEQWLGEYPALARD
jgi:hypothetical protein